MKNKLKAILLVIRNILTALAVLVVMIVGVVIFYLCITNLFNASKCNYNYVDYNGNLEVSDNCRSEFGILYCEKENSVIKVNEVEKVCQ